MLQRKKDWLTKRQKYVKGKPCKPYNSTLGEFFRVRSTPNTLRHLADSSSVTGKSKTHIPL